MFPQMRPSVLVALSFLPLPILQAQYGTFDAKAVTAAKANTTLVVLDDGDSPFNRTIMDAMKANWKFTVSMDFINTHDLATQPIDPTKNYVMKVTHSDPEKHEATFLVLVRGWKPKKGEVLNVANGAVTNMPLEQELASVMIDANALANTSSAMLHVYVKNMQDYLKQVESGKIKDKTTADRLYQSRNRTIKDMELWIAKEHLDKSIPDEKKARETYSKQLQVMDLAQVMAAATEGKPGVAISDMLLTGEYKTKWCFKRVFNANTGELMYLRDDAALSGKKEGFIGEDFRMLEQSR